MTLADLRTAVRQRADIENSSGVYTNAYIKDPELNSYINQSAFELYDLLVTLYGEDYYIAPFSTFVTDGSSQLYSLPSDFYKMLNVSVQSTSGSANNAWWTLKQFNISEVNKYSVPNTQIYFGLTNLRYRIQGNQIWFSPLPISNTTVRLIYCPRMTSLVADSDVLDGISGWTEYVIIDAAIKCMQKEESDISVLAAQKVAMVHRINASASNRDAGMPSTVADVRDANSFAPYGNGGFY